MRHRDVLRLHPRAVLAGVPFAAGVVLAVLALLDVAQTGLATVFAVAVSMFATLLPTPPPSQGDDR